MQNKNQNSGDEKGDSEKIDSVSMAESIRVHCDNCFFFNASTFLLFRPGVVIKNLSNRFRCQTGNHGNLTGSGHRVSSFRRYHASMFFFYLFVDKND